MDTGCRTQEWDTGMEGKDGAQVWHIGVRNRCEAQVQGTGVKDIPGHSCGAQVQRIDMMHRWEVPCSSMNTGGMFLLQTCGVPSSSRRSPSS